MEITILSCLAAAFMLTVALARFHDGNRYLIYITRKTRSVCSRVNLKYFYCIIHIDKGSKFLRNIWKPYIY